MKILVIRFSSLGDVILTTPVFYNLKMNYPQSIIKVLVKEEFSQVFENNPYIDEIIKFSKSKHLYSQIKSLRKEKFDLLIDLHRSIRSRIFYFTIPAIKKISYRKNSLSRIFAAIFHQKKEFPLVVNLYLATLKKLKIEIKREKTEIFLTLQEREKTEDFLKKNGINKSEKIIGIHPGARKFTRRWPEENYPLLVKKLLENNLSVLFFIPPEENNFQKVFSATPIDSSKLIFLSKTKLREYFSFVSFCDSLLCMDSSSIHIANALNVPVVAIYGSTASSFGFKPLQEKDIIIEKQLRCHPCSVHGKNKCPKRHFKCMKDINVDEVFSAIISQVKNE